MVAPPSAARGQASGVTPIMAKLGTFPNLTEKFATGPFPRAAVVAG